MEGWLHCCTFAAKDGMPVESACSHGTNSFEAWKRRQIIGWRTDQAPPLFVCQAVQLGLGENWNFRERFIGLPLTSLQSRGSDSTSELCASPKRVLRLT